MPLNYYEPFSSVTRGSTVVNVDIILETAEVVPKLPQQEQTTTETDPIPSKSLIIRVSEYILLL
jgi:hypothetical protein